MSYFNGTKNIPKFGGDIWYVSKNNGSDSNEGKSPTLPFETIGQAISSISAGDAITVMAGTYTETGLDLNVNNCELWFEIGTVIQPASGTALTVSANYCLTKGMHTIIPAAGQIGMLVSGDFCHLEHGRIITGGTGIRVTGDGLMLSNYACGNQTVMAYDLQGGAFRGYNLATVGVGATYGYHINSSSDTGVLKNCTSVGHETSGYYIGTGSINWTIIDCSTGGGDGKWRDIDDTNVWSGFTYPETKYKELTLDDSHAYNLFKVTGAVEIVSIFGHVTGHLVDANTNVYFQLYSSAGVDEITKTTDANLGAATVGTVIVKTEDPGKALTILESGTPSVDKTADPKKRGVFLNADTSNDTYIRWVCGGNNDTDGRIHFHIVWRPLTDDGFVEVV